MPPIKETINPTGISEGARIFRPIVSATSNNNAPNNAEVISIYLWLEPTNFRARCGMTRPRKAIAPPTATLAKCYCHRK